MKLGSKKFFQIGAFLVLLFLSRGFMSFGDDEKSIYVEPGYTQGAAISGAVFQGKPFRSFSGKRVFSKGWEKRILKHPLTWETIATKHLKKHYGDKSKLQTNCTKWNVVTTIFKPTEAILDAARMGHDWCTVIVGDKKSPKDFLSSEPLLANDDSVFYLDVDQQEDWEKLPGALGAFCKMLPYNHFARKNLGFLYAIIRGAKFIYDFDDDNYVNKDAYGKPLELIPNEKEIEGVRFVSVPTKAFNHHPLMGATIDASWPRGFPLERILDTETHGSVVSTGNTIPMEKVGVIQYLANTNPDIDAVHRMTKPLPMDFADETASTPILVPHNTSAPFNAQATVHHHPAFFATLLPITVQGRVTDIWRSYYTVPLFRDLDVSLLFVPPRITQIRNVHSYIGDMKAEGDLYFKSDKLTQFLHHWSSAEMTLPERMEQLWIDLYERGYHGVEDVYLVQHWLAALAHVGFDFPQFL